MGKTFKKKVTKVEKKPGKLAKIDWQARGDQYELGKQVVDRKTIKFRGEAEKRVADMLHEARVKKGLSLPRMTEVGLTSTAMYRYEHGKVLPGVIQLFGLMKKLGLDLLSLKPAFTAAE